MATDPIEVDSKEYLDKGASIVMKNKEDDEIRSIKFKNDLSDSISSIEEDVVNTVENQNKEQNNLYQKKQKKKEKNKLPIRQKSEMMPFKYKKEGYIEVFSFFYLLL